MKLGTLLIRDGVINLDQLEEALRAQVVKGGKLGTNLVELGHISIETLTCYLGRLLGLPAVTRERLEVAASEVVRTLPAAVALAALAVPFARDGDVLSVAFADPRDEAARQRVADATPLTVRPHIAPEMAVRAALARWYGLAQPRGDEGGALLAASSGPVAIPRPALSLQETLAALDAAASRDALADAVLRFCEGRLACVLLLEVQEGVARAWRAAGPDLDIPSLQELELRVADSVCLRPAAAGASWRGGASGRPESPDEALFLALCTPDSGDEAMTAPLAADGGEAPPVILVGRFAATADDSLADAIVSVCEAASGVYTRLARGN